MTSFHERLDWDVYIKMLLFDDNKKILNKKSEVE